MMISGNGDGTVTCLDFRREGLFVLRGEIVHEPVVVLSLAVSGVPTAIRCRISVVMRHFLNVAAGSVWVEQKR